MSPLQMEHELPPQVTMGLPAHLVTAVSWLYDIFDAMVLTVKKVKKNKMLPVTS